MPSRPARPAVLALGGVLGVLLVVILGTWAASIGPGGVFQDPGHAVSTRTPSAPASTATPDSGIPSPPTPNDATNPRWVVDLGLIVQGLLVIALLVLLARLMGAFRHEVRERRLRRRPSALPGTPFDVLDDPARLTAELARDAVRRRDLLAQGTPRNGIVLCWHEFEVAAGRVGLVRKPWETPAEFTLRLLDLVSADGMAVTDLAGRYREARFSDHEVTETDRAAAVADLARIDVSLGLVAP